MCSLAAESAAPALSPGVLSPRPSRPLAGRRALSPAEPRGLRPAPAPPARPALRAGAAAAAAARCQRSRALLRARHLPRRAVLGWVVTPHPVRCSHVPNKTRFFLGPTCIRTVSRVPVTPTSSVIAVVLEVKAGRKNSSVWTSRGLLYILHPPMVSRIFLCSHL